MSAHDFEFQSIDGGALPLSGFKGKPVLGGNAHPFYRWIESAFGEAAAPRWNIHKYLLGPDGELAGMWPSGVELTASEVVEAVEALLEA